jgi:tryptophanyl-tRNA synthetase
MKNNLISTVPTGKRLYSAISPTGDGTLHIGNYLGAVKQFIELAKNNECFLQIANIHALTTVQNKTQLQKNQETLILNELALLGDLKNISFCTQSDVGLHTELQSIINNVTPLGLIKRAHAYKDKLAKDVREDDINMGLFCYPVLMAADILIYKVNLVPVGKDQKQHVEIARDIAERFNKTFKKNIFPLPEPYIPEEVATILGTDGKRKMSKTLGNIISIFEDEAIIKKQVMGCYTDPTRAHANDPGHIEGNMVFTYLKFFGETEKVKELKTLYTQGKVADVEVKQYLFDSLMKYFAPARARYQELKANPTLVKEILEKGTTRAREVAGQTMKEVREAVGLMNNYSFLPVIPHLMRDPQRDPSQKPRDDTVITIDDFSKVELRVGKVTMAENVEKSEKLIRLHVDFAEFGQRVIFTGVRTYGFTLEDFIGKQFFFVTNLQYRKMLGEESQGMILAVGDDKPIFVSAEGLPIGSKIR